MIDLHCHILPGIDDGAPDLEAALEMAEAAAKNGISHLLCTPHHNNGAYTNPKAEVIAQVTALQEAIDIRGIPLTLYEGQEVRITGELIKEWDDNQLLTTDITNRYLLIEFPTQDVPTYTEQIFFELINRGVTPIIVHPERNSVFLDDPNKLVPFLNMGVLAQLTAPSYLGIFGKKIQKVAKLMLEHNMVQMIATDAHNLEKRGFFLRQAYDLLEKDFGKRKVSAFQQMTRDILNGDEVTIAAYSEATKGLLGSWK